MSRASLPEAARDELQRTLAGEHAALAVLAVLGGRTSASGQPTLRAQLDAAWANHRALRDEFDALLRTAGTEPVAAEPDYVLPGPSGTPAQVRVTAALVEERCTALYAALVAQTVGEIRIRAIELLRESAVRELALGRNPVHFPGAAEFTNR